jgi:hypothetical protein
VINKNKTKAFQVRLPIDTWKFLKKIAIDQERSMASIIENCVEKYRKKLENRLTSSDTVVS